MRRDEMRFQPYEDDTVTLSTYRREAPKAGVTPVQIPVESKPDDWRDQAACKGLPISVFFPKGLDSRDGDGDPAAMSPRAVACCDRCPVRADCLEWALRDELGDGSGILAGTTPKQRRAIARKRLRRARVAAAPDHEPSPTFYSYGCRCDGCKAVYGRNRFRARVKREAS